MLISPSSIVHAEIQAEFAAASTPISSGAPDAVARTWSRQSWIDNGFSTAPAVVKAYKAQSSNYFDAVATNGVTLGTDTRIAWDLFVRRLTNGGIGSALTYIYPWLGGTANTNRINAGSAGPAAGLGTFSGTVTHNASGVTSDGATGYFNTGVAPAHCMDVDDGCIFAYTLQAEANGATRIFLGATGPASIQGAFVGHNRAGTAIAGAIASEDVNSKTAGIEAPDVPGLKLTTAKGSRLEKTYSPIGTAEFTTSATISTGVISILRMGGAGAYGYCSKTNALAGFGRGLTDAQVVAFNGYVVELMAALGRTAT